MVGAGASVSAAGSFGCGKSHSSDAGGTAGDGSPTSGGASGRESGGSAGRDELGGSAGSAAITGGTGGAGGRGGEVGGSAGDAVSAAGISSAGQAGAGTGQLDPGPSAQWNCEGMGTTCQTGTSGPYAGLGTALLLTKDCPVEADRPRQVSDCSEGEEMLCHLAVDTEGKQKLVNCECEPVDDAGCTQCVSITGQTVGALGCRDGIKICPCAFTGILR